MLNKLNSDNKKILLLIDNLGSGGAQNQLTLLAVGLKEKGYDVSVFTYFPQDFFLKRLTDNKVKHIYCPKKDKIGFGVVRALSKLVEIERFDTLISFLDTPNFYAALAKKMSKHQPKVIISYRSKTEFELLSWSALKIKEWTNRQADTIVTNSNHEAKTWSNRYKELTDKITVIYNFVDFPEKNPQQTNFSQQTKFLVVGTVSHFKNGKLIINALSRLKAENYHFSLTWLGRKAFSDDDTYFKEMCALLEECNLTDNWIWEEPKREIKVETYYRSHSALVLASTIEGLPNVVCEAMSVGMPIIVSDCLDHPLLINEPENGFLFNPNNSDDLAQKLKLFLYLNETELANLRAANIKKAKFLFNEDVFMEKYINII